MSANDMSLSALFCSVCIFCVYFLCVLFVCTYLTPVPMFDIHKSCEMRKLNDIMIVAERYHPLDSVVFLRSFLLPFAILLKVESNEQIR